MLAGGDPNRPPPEQLLERAIAVAVATLLTFLLFLVLHRMTTDWARFTNQYLAPVRYVDDAWGRIVSGSLVLAVIGWGTSCAGLALLDVYARLRGTSPWIKAGQWKTGLAVAAVAMLLTFLVVRAG